METRAPKVLVVGVDGEIGSYVFSDLQHAGFETLGTSRKESHISEAVHANWDLRDELFPMEFQELTAAVICASMDPKACDLEPKLAREVNVSATIRLATELVRRGIFVLFLSSNSVFDGRVSFAGIDNEVEPRNLYGKLKAEVEQELLTLGGSAVLRLTKVISANSPIVKFWRGEGGDSERPVAFDNVLVSPIEINHVSGAIQDILRSRTPGVYHLGGLNEFTFADLAVDYFKNEPDVLSKIKIEPSPSAEGRRLHNSLTTRLPPQEAQYSALHSSNRVQMGLMSGYAYLEDPKRLTFTLARYKFVSKVLAGCSKTLEIGCADAFGSPLVSKEVTQLIATDFDQSFVSDAKQSHPYSSEIEFRVHDMLGGGSYSRGF